MADDIQIAQPDWANVPDHCPNCQTEFKDSIPNRNVFDIGYSFQDGKSKHGEYTELECNTCGIVVQRHYENNNITPQDDPLTSPSAWVYRAQVLEMETVLKHREAQVRALKELEKSHAEIGEILDISESTVSEYSRRINTRIEESARTLEELGRDINPFRHLVSQFDGWVVTPAKQWSCANCDGDLRPGTDVVVVAEYVGRNWQELELFCTDCTSDDTVTTLLEQSGLDGLVAETREYGGTCAIVEGTLDIQGDDYVHIPHSPDSRESLTLREPEIQEVLN